MLDATHVARQLGLSRDSEVSVSLLVTNHHTGATVPATEYRELPGFAPVICWGRAMPSAGAAGPAIGRDAGR